jgi:hypothetical protein
VSNRRKLARQHRTQYWLLEFYNTEHGPTGGHCADCGKRHDGDESAELIGAAIVPAHNLDQAADHAWDLGCNPGGSIRGGTLPDGLIERVRPKVPVGILLPSDVVPHLYKVLGHWASAHMGD